MNAECKIVKAETKDGFVATYHLMQNGRKIGVEINISSPFCRHKWNEEMEGVYV